MIMAMLLLLAAPKDADKEVQFQADNCSYGRAMSEAVCSGRVHEKKKKKRLRCRSLTVRFGEDGRIEQLVCVGAVKFRRGEAEEATGERAAYTRNDAKVVLQGEAKLRRGRARLAGDRVIFLLDEDKVRVEGQARGHFDNEER